MERASCLVIINLDFVFLSLIYFLPSCFDLKDLNLKKRFEPLRKDSPVYLTKCSKCMLFTLPNQTAGSQAFIFRNKQSIAIHSKPNENSVRLVENMG